MQVSYRFRYLKQLSGTDRLRQVCKFQCSYTETDKPATARHPACQVQVRHANLPGWLRVKTPIYLQCIWHWSQSRLQFCRCECKCPNCAHQGFAVYG